MRALALACCCIATSAQASSESLEAQAKILLKAVAYDEGAPRDAIRVLIVHHVADAAAGERAREAFASSAGMTVQGRPVQAASLSFASIDDVARALAKQAYPYWYVAGTVPEAHVSSLARLAEQARSLTMVQDGTLLSRGFGMAVQNDGDRREVLVNLPVLVAAGHQLSGTFLQVCTVIR